MNRKNKFRGQDIKTKEWLYGDLVHSADGKRTAILVNDRDCYDECEVYSNTVGEFINNLDKNGNEIYEDDIVKFYYMTADACSSKLISTKEMVGLITTNEYNQWIILSDGMEIHIENAVKYGTIVGNIHDILNCYIESSKNERK